MDFTDAANRPEKEDESNNRERGSENTENTVPAVARLENDIEKVYTSIESKLATFWSTATRSVQNFQIAGDEKSDKNLTQKGDEVSWKDSDPKHPANEKNEENSQRSKDVKIDLGSITVSANRALDELDSKLEVVEQTAGTYVSSLASFLTGAVSSTSSKWSEKTSKSSSSLPTIPGDVYGSSRYDMELFKLHTTMDTFIGVLDDDEEAELAAFQVDEKTQEVSNLLAKYSETLEILMSRLVPTQLTYKQFWYRYFKQDERLKAGEQARKKLLTLKDKKDGLSALRKDLDNREGDDKEKIARLDSRRIKSPHAHNLREQNIGEGEGEGEEEEEEEDFTWDDDEDPQNVSS